MELLLLSFLLIQCFVGFFLLRKLDRGFYIQDIRMFFLCFYSLYSVFWPLMNYVFEISPVDNAYLETLFCYGLALVPFNLLLITKKVRWCNSNNIETISINNTIGLSFAAFLVFFAVFFMVSAGIPVFRFGENMANRRDYFSVVSQFWIVLNIIISTLFCLLTVKFKTFNKCQQTFFIAVVIFYISFQLSMGNRREFASFLMFVMGYILILKRSKLNFKVLTLLLCLFVGSFVVSMKREASTRDMAGNEAVQMALQSNEFVFPMQTTYYTIKDDWSYRFGSTYLFLPVQVLIPRAIYPGKPDSLGSEFVNKTFGSGWMAFAYTPVTEAYLNGGYLGIIIVFSLLSSFLNKLVKKANYKVDFWYLIFISLCLDWSRSEFSSIIYTLFIIWLCFFVFTKRTVTSRVELHTCESNGH